MPSPVCLSREQMGFGIAALDEINRRLLQERKKASDKPLDPDDEAKKVQETLKRKADFERRKREERTQWEEECGKDKYVFLG
eukprot:g19717.t1